MKLERNEKVNLEAPKTSTLDSTLDHTLPEATFGQKLADAMASKVGSWSFLIGQTAVLAGWVGVNLTPGVPHWDESPFILLNLVFSFASAYTAPVVLMSQNRQSDEDRAHAYQNHQVNLQTAQNLELLQQKLDEVYAQKLTELSDLIKQTHEAKVLFTAAQTQPSVDLMQQALSNSVPQLHLSNYVGLLPNPATPSALSQTTESSAANPVPSQPSPTALIPSDNFANRKPD